MNVRDGVTALALKPVVHDGVFAWTTFFVESYAANMTLPTHDVVLTAVAIVNHPVRVQTTTRRAVRDRLRGIAGLVTPPMTASRHGAVAPFYTASKAAVTMLTTQYARALPDIRVNADDVLVVWKLNG